MSATSMAWWSMWWNIIAQSIPARVPLVIVYEFLLTVSGWNSDMCLISN